MNHDGRIMPINSSQPDEDDWETADISFPQTGPARANQAHARQTHQAYAVHHGQHAQPFNPSLRPSAPAFVPRPGVSAPGPPPAGGPSRTLFNPNGPNASASAVAGGSGGVGGGKEEEEDEWFGSRRPVTNRQLWDSANNAPPPTIISPSPIHPGSTVPPAPVMQILRRDPSSQNSGKRSGSGGAGKKTMEERAEEYRLARERIFGQGGGGDSGEGGAGEGEGSVSRGRSGNGQKRGGGSASGKNTPISTPSTAGFNQGGGPGLGDQGLRLVPTQVKRSPVGSPNPQAPPDGRRSGNITPKGVLRQPRGPGEGGGFAR